jgi:hypothetical protein
VSRRNVQHTLSAAEIVRNKVSMELLNLGLPSQI